MSFTVENKMSNSHKRGWSHFQLNINDWGISFPKMLRICQWIGKNIFHWGKWNEPIKLIKKCVWGHSEIVFTLNFKFLTCSLLFIPVHFTCRMLMNFWMKSWLFFCKLNIKDGNIFYTDIYCIYDNNNKNIYMFIYKKKFKKMSTSF